MTRKDAADHIRVLLLFDYAAIAGRGVHLLEGSWDLVLTCNWAYDCTYSSPIWIYRAHPQARFSTTVISSYQVLATAPPPTHEQLDDIYDLVLYSPSYDPYYRLVPYFGKLSDYDLPPWECFISGWRGFHTRGGD